MYDIMLDQFHPTVLLILPNGGTVACSPRMRSYIVNILVPRVVSLSRWWRQWFQRGFTHLQGGKDRTIST